MESPQVLLRIAAFLVDALLIGLVLVLAGTTGSWIVIFVQKSTNYLGMIWAGTFVLMLVGIALRDGWRGRSFGKRIFGLSIRRRNGHRCGFVRSIVRNLPLIVPIWNLVEIVMIFASSDGRRSGDRIAGTQVKEE